MGVVASSLLARTGAVRMTRHVPASQSASAPAQPSVSGKRRQANGNGGGNGNGGMSDEEALLSDGRVGKPQQQQQGQQQQRQQQPFVLPFKAFCVCFCVTTLVLTALSIGKQNIAALQKPLPPGVLLPSQTVCADL
jgi:hypothetical protein